MSDFEVRTTIDAGGNDHTLGNAALSKQRQGVVMDFYTYMAAIGAAYQTRSGTITTPIVGKAVNTDTAAEFCVDAVAGALIIPVYQNISVRLGTGTLHEYGTKSVNAVSTAGTAFIPLPLRNLGPDSGTAATAASKGVTARVDTAGGVTVAAELTTTTRRHWGFANPVVVGAGNGSTILEWIPRMPPHLTGPVCLYTQIAATTTGPSYYANLDFIAALAAALI